MAMLSVIIKRIKIMKIWKKRKFVDKLSNSLLLLLELICVLCHYHIIPNACLTPYSSCSTNLNLTEISGVNRVNDVALSVWELPLWRKGSLKTVFSPQW